MSFIPSLGLGYTGFNLDFFIKRMKHFSTISAYSKYLNILPPEHPQVMVLDLEKDTELLKNQIKNSPPITNDFYLISMKRVIQGQYIYGRTQYDFQKGIMLFTSPNQVLAWENVEIDRSGYAITFHKDFLKGHELFNKIKDYHFFNYSVNESLHLSPIEEKTIEMIYKNLYKEYYANPDDFSKDIILAHIDTLLQYCKRFYNRQFIHRKELNKSIVFRFKRILQRHLDEGLLQDNGVPSLQFLAEEMQMSQRYMSDALKKETGQSATDNINLFLIEQAKNLLLMPNVTVSETAYSLGFEYPQYFSRLFKKKTGMSPKTYIESSSLN